uniref:ATP synthase complex subunit 8 n=1 Tax=Mattiphus splendidus TaxID=1603602 RepID=A0A7M1IC96_9HEMI|nr:ATP synthase F0 subunit 8 [Mattiphus splendidus]QOQ37013.1 ATP synthase F0 subunit 8 [Mattiphus splendidus]
MPQMAPLWWESLFIMFIILFLIMSMIIYHLIKPKKMKLKSLNKMVYQMNWKW